MESGGEEEQGGLLIQNRVIDSFFWFVRLFFCVISPAMTDGGGITPHLLNTGHFICSHSHPRRLFPSSPVTINGLIRNYANDP